MRSVHVCIGHDYDLMIASILDVEVLFYSCSKSGYHGLDFLAAEDFVQPRLLHIEDLALERQYCLKCTVSRLFG